MSPDPSQTDRRANPPASLFPGPLLPYGPSPCSRERDCDPDSEDRARNVMPGESKIAVLPAEVAGRIAAGEVVERPASVVKELVENSLDAGSTRITVEVTEGGRGVIRVTDDGEGMSRADASLAFQRYATSKLRSDRDLSSLRTMGFRGEALPSIAVVSKVRLVTMPRGEPVGTELWLSGGTLDKVQETAAAPGTRIEVSELFFNTPARRKFLKATATEFSHICQVVQQASLVWPNVHFTLTHNGQEVFQYPAVASSRDRVLQIYGARFLDHMREIRSEQPAVRATGFVVSPLYTGAGRSPQDLFVNRRPIKNATVTHAVYEAYGASLAKGRHPQFVLLLDMDPRHIDVNVHPTKREIRCADQILLHRAVHQAVRDALRDPLRDPLIEQPVATDSLSGGPGPAQVWFPGPRPEQGELSPRSLSLSGEAAQTYFVRADEEVVPLGQISRMFLVAQVGSELQVIDQHTAHERVLFERLCRAWRGQAVALQPLLIPEPVELPPHAATVLADHLADLEKVGLTIEPFGANTFLVRAAPALLGQLDHASLIQDLVEDLTLWNSPASMEAGLDARVRPILASLACHGAVRAGRPMEPSEAKRLIEDWIAEGLPATCPHGRRVALRLSEGELARIFGRA